MLQMDVNVLLVLLLWYLVRNQDDVEIRTKWFTLRIRNKSRSPPRSVNCNGRSSRRIRRRLSERRRKR